MGKFKYDGGYLSEQRSPQTTETRSAAGLFSRCCRLVYHSSHQLFAILWLFLDTSKSTIYLEFLK